MGLDANGNFVVAREDDQDGDGSYTILARSIFADGTKARPVFRVHAASSGQHLAPAVSMAPSGAFAVAWQEDADDDGTFDVRGRTFYADGSGWLGKRDMNRVRDGQQLAPKVAVGVSGAIAAVWEDDMDGNGAVQVVARGLDGP